MKPSVVVGNDVVDLADPRVQGKAGDDRFVARVLAPAERDGLRGAADPDVELWRLWAAKEAAYKVVSKLRGEPPVFEHAAFGVAWTRGASESASGSRDRFGVVRHGDARVLVRVARERGVLHAVAHSHVEPAAAVRLEVGLERLDDPLAPWAGSQDDLLALFTPREAEAVHSRASAAVRLGARRALASMLVVKESRVEIVCRAGVTGRRPPYVLLDGEETAADVSLSHGGGWIGWALWTAAAQPPWGR